MKATDFELRDSLQRQQLNKELLKEDTDEEAGGISGEDQG